MRKIPNKKNKNKNKRKKEKKRNKFLSFRCHANAWTPTTVPE
jgi:hypothetical protein